MRARLSVIAIIAILAAAIAASIGLAAPNMPERFAQRAGIPVDVELVLAVDVSYSMDPDEQALQREGYIEAITSPDFLRALRQGIHAKVAMTYFEWAGSHHQQIIVPWRLIDSPEAADGFVAEIARARYSRASRTSISSRCCS